MTKRSRFFARGAFITAHPGVFIFIATLVGSTLLLLAAANSSGAEPQRESASERLTCYENVGELVKPEFELNNVSLTVHWYNTVEELGSATGQHDAEALSSCEHYPVANMAFCEVWVARPRNVVGDPQMDSLGHEVLHGLMGDFHK